MNSCGSAGIAPRRAASRPGGPTPGSPVAAIAVAMDATTPTSTIEAANTFFIPNLRPGRGSITRRSSLDELVVGLDPAVSGQDHEFQADAEHLAIRRDSL